MIALSRRIDIWPLGRYSKTFVLITQNLISYFTMVLQVAEQGEQFFTAAGIPSDIYSNIYYQPHHRNYT